MKISKGTTDYSNEANQGQLSLDRVFLGGSSASFCRRFESVIKRHMGRFFAGFLILLSLACHAQSDFDKALAIHKEADSCLWRDGCNKAGAQRKYRDAQALFEVMDSTYYALKSEVRVLYTAYFIGDLTVETAKELVVRIMDNGIEDSLLAYGHWLEGIALVSSFQIDEAALSMEKAFPVLLSERCYDQAVRGHWMLAYGYALERDRESSARYAMDGLAILRNLPLSHFRLHATLVLTVEVIQHHAQKGDHKKVMSRFVRANDLFMKSDSLLLPDEKAYFFAQVGDVFAELGDYERAYSYMKRAADEGISGAKINLCVLLESMGRYDEAQNGYLQLIAEYDLNTNDRALVLSNIANCYLRTGDLRKAEEMCIASIDLSRDGPEARLFDGLTSYAEVLIALSNFKSARALLQKAEKLDFHSDDILMVKSLLHKRQGNLDSALAYIKMAVFDDFGDVVLGRASTFSFFASLQQCQELAAIYDEATTVNLSSLLQESINTSYKLHQFASNFQEIHKQASLDLTERTAFIYEQGIRHSLLLSFNQGFEDYSEKAFQFSEWSKGHALQRAKKSADAKRQEIIPSELLELEYDLKIDGNYFRSEVSRFRSEKNSTKTNEYLARLEINSFRQDSLQSVFRNDYLRYYQLRYQDITLSVKEIQERLEPQQAFLEYYEGDTTSFLFVITPDNYAVHPLALHQDSLISELRKFFQPETFEQPAQAYYDKAYEIYQSYLSPAIESLSPTISELIVVPDGKLSYVPFEVLLQEAHQSDNWSGPIPYLLRDYQIHYTYSAGLYFNEFTSLSSNDRFLAFAPDYASTLSDTVTLNGLGAFRNQITPLRYNREEVNYLQETFDGLGFVAAAASERNFKQHLDDNAGILHLAMHTILDDEDPLQSRLIFTNTEDSVEDDQLHAYEIYNMRVPAQLTVLSACETGFGQLAKGEGALSLARAFAYAGSPSVVMSHWPVDDEVTAQVMQSFYDYLAEGYTKSEALRQAKLDYLDKGLPSRMHPFFWGSFVVMGDDAALALSTKWGWNTYALWVLMLSVVAVGMIRWIRPGSAGRTT